ncbi:MAG: Asp-tRNA(Asn)/Glu-tRNA(Gln) amidotransferase GatCAB subunit A [Deltaproteobacteria bacterium]|nr:Asp-tRNA(Asn)/Glu-tRNA(Gln) amidotransferase GatCAB subunit A [Deltaproteobacteria bacterium]
MTEEEIVWQDVSEIQQATAKGTLSAREITDTFLSRIERLDPALQAYSVVYPERARAQADRLDAAAAEGRPAGALHGVGVALKDLCDVAGEPTKAGTTALGATPAAVNAEVVDRLEAAGAVILGKVKMTEGAFVEHHPSVEPPRNPWNVARWTGISSSGSGVAVAAGLCTLALGTDTGGSIRYPSAANGLSGLKPTHGRVSIRGVQPLADSLDHIGPMARSARDAALAFEVLCGHDPGDPWSLVDHPPSIAVPPSPKVRGLKIGFDPRFAEDDVAPFVSAVAREALEVYRALGAEIVEFSLPDYSEAMGGWLFIGAPEIANAHADTYPKHKEAYGAALAEAIELGRSTSALDAAKAWRTRTAWTRRLEGCFEAGSATCPDGAPEGLDALLAPVIPGPFPANANLGDPGALPNGAAAMRFTGPFNMSGSPSLTMCGGFDEDGAPIGFQIVGPRLSESTLLALGAAYQDATDFHTRRPAL